MPCKCFLAPEEECASVAFGSTWQSGCGYLRLEWEGDVSNHGVSIWNENSRGLVYRWDNGSMSAGCMPDTTVGTEPECDEWVDACASVSAGGAGSGS